MIVLGMNNRIAILVLTSLPFGCAQEVKKDSVEEEQTLSVKSNEIPDESNESQPQKPETKVVYEESIISEDIQKIKEPLMTVIAEIVEDLPVVEPDPILELDEEPDELPEAVTDEVDDSPVMIPTPQMKSDQEITEIPLKTVQEAPLSTFDFPRLYRGKPLLQDRHKSKSSTENPTNSP